MVLTPNKRLQALSLGSHTELMKRLERCIGSTSEAFRIGLRWGGQPQSTIGGQNMKLWEAARATDIHLIL